jgi:hypothetical protein
MVVDDFSGQLKNNVACELAAICQVDYLHTNGFGSRMILTNVTPQYDIRPSRNAL